jgi:hypothetical protein
MMVRAPYVVMTSRRGVACDGVERAGGLNREQPTTRTGNMSVLPPVGSGLAAEVPLSVKLSAISAAPSPWTTCQPYDKIGAS